MAEETVLTSPGETTPVQVETTPKVEDSATSLPEGEIKAGEEAPETPKPPEKKKERGVQRRIDELVREREYYRGLAEGRQVKSPAETAEIPGLVLPPEPNEADFDDYGKYLKAVAQHGVKVELLKERATRDQETHQQTRQQLIDAYNQWVDEGEDKVEGFAEIAGHVGNKITPHMGDAIRDSEFSHELVNFLYEHPKEMSRIAVLPPTAAVREIIKLEGRLSQPPQRSETNAPLKTKPAGGKEVPGGKIENLSYKDYKAARERALGWRQ